MSNNEERIHTSLTRTCNALRDVSELLANAVQAGTESDRRSRANVEMLGNNLNQTRRSLQEKTDQLEEGAQLVNDLLAQFSDEDVDDDGIVQLKRLKQWVEKVDR